MVRVFHIINIHTIPPFWYAQTDTQRVIYAISPDGSDDLSYHTATNRGAKSLYLRRKVGTDTKVPDDAITMDITVDNVSVF